MVHTATTTIDRLPRQDLQITKHRIDSVLDVSSNEVITLSETIYHFDLKAFTAKTLSNLCDQLPEIVVFRYRILQN